MGPAAVLQELGMGVAQAILVCPSSSGKWKRGLVVTGRHSNSVLVLSPQAPGWNCTSAVTGTAAACQPQFLFIMVTWRKSCWMPSMSLDGAAPRVLTVTGGCRHMHVTVLLYEERAARLWCPSP